MIIDSLPNSVVVNRQSLEAVAADVVDLVLVKNHDYGDAWQRHGLAGVLIRLSDKSLRLENINGREVLVVDELADKTLEDIAGYALLGLLKARQEQGMKGLAR